jgi:hypothetical protein
MPETEIIYKNKMKGINRVVKNYSIEFIEIALDTHQRERRFMN